MIVLDITKYFGPTTGGIRTVLLEKARYVAAREDIRQVVVVPGPEAAVADEGRTRWYTLRSPPIPFDRNYRFLWQARELRRILELERPDVIELGSPLLVPWLVRLANRRLRIPVVWFYHGHLPAIVHPPGSSGPAAFLEPVAWSYVRRVAAGCRATLVAAASVEAELRQHHVRAVRLVSLGVDLDIFHPGRRARAVETRARWGLPSGPLVAYFGRRSREKQLHVPLAAWPEVHRATGARLVLAGVGPADLPSRLKSLVTCLPHLRARDEAADLLAAMDIYLAPGPAETFGLSAWEAMASGTPVLTADRGGVADLVRASGAGACYLAGSANGCASAAIALLRQDHASLGAVGREYVARQGAWTPAFDQLFELYRECVS